MPFLILKKSLKMQRCRLKTYAYNFLKTYAIISFLLHEPSIFQLFDNKNLNILKILQLTAEITIFQEIVCQFIQIVFNNCDVLC